MQNNTAVTSEKKPVSTVTTSDIKKMLEAELLKAFYAGDKTAEKTIKKQIRDLDRPVMVFEPVCSTAEYKGAPMFVVKFNPADKFPFQFGLRKAKMLLSPAVQSAIKAFVDANETK